METNLKISFIAPEIGEGTASSIAALPLFKKKGLSNSAKAYDKVSGKQISAAVKASGFDGSAGKAFEVVGPKGTKTNRLYVCGCGELGKFDAEMFGAKVAKANLMGKEATLILHMDGMDMTAVDGARAALGAVLAAYRFDKYRTKLPASKKPSLKAVKIAIENPAKARAAYKNFYGPIGEGTLLARDLVSEPANKLFPKSYAARIKKMEALGLKVEILGEKRMETLGMGALLGVGLGSARESQLVVMKWNGGKKGAKPVCVVGKGVTFDTGGISLKPGAGMWDMKGDMGGSAAVVGAMHTLAARKAKANVIGIVGLVENMPDGKAQNPGDIVTSMSGQTIEVQNTDAEGRLVLCDALWYAKERFKPKAMVDLATLTGAILVSLGHEYGGVFSNSDEIAKQLEAAAETSTEKVWRLPLGDAFDKMIDSPNADMKNIGGRLAGSITAAQFLQRFVGDTPWAHLDIAGAAWKAKSDDFREPAWATGFGARLINRWIADNFEG
jgi:leucyl aminopeptidase